MKILFAVQGTGNGHISRAREILPHLKNHGEVDVLISGTDSEVIIDSPVAFKLHGLGYVFGKKGGIDIQGSLKKFRPQNLLNDLSSLPVEKYDVVINDFEPISAWACKLKKRHAIALSHQSAYLSSKTPRPEKTEWFGETVLKNYAPSSKSFGFHFDRYDTFIYPPVIRREIRNLETSNKGHYTVYLPAYSDEAILEVLEKIDVYWEVFSKHSKTIYSKGNISFIPVNNELFNKSLASCEGLLTGAGFESPAEALFLSKKVMAIPMKMQYEQKCNAAGLKKIGVPVIDSFSPEYLNEIKNWVANANVIPVNYPDITAQIVSDAVKCGYELNRNS